jgi:hypothetical protein
MIRLVFIDNHKVTSRDFENIGNAYEFAIKNIATESDRSYYQNLAGETFEKIIKKVPFGKKKKLMQSILDNALENVVKVFELRS